MGVNVNKGNYYGYLNPDLLYEPAVPLLGIYPREMKSTYETVICTFMLLETQLTIVKI